MCRLDLASLAADMANNSDGKPFITALAGLVLAACGILGGFLLEGGRFHDVVQVTAALIVGGGTMGAVLVSTPIGTLRRASRRARSTFFGPGEDLEELTELLISFATKARKNGLVSLEDEALEIEDSFLRKGMNLAVDGAEITEIRSMMTLEMQIEEARALAETKVFESAGGYAPTIGILGAVMGLIQVMKNLANMDEVGHGIAVAFVATLYGVGLANLVLIPTANKMRAKIHRQLERREMSIEGVVGIMEGLNPKLLRIKLEAFHEPDGRSDGKNKRSKTVRNHVAA